MAALFLLAMKASNLGSYSSSEGYVILAGFENIGGLKVSSPVTVAGVRVGRVTAIEYDDSRFEAVVSLQIDPDYDSFPEDTSASIYTAGLLGEQYIALEPGGSEIRLEQGDRLQLTQSALVLEQVIGQFIYSISSKENEN